jgi:hypothetical protein
MTDTFQWRRCDAAGGSCSDIGGATAQTYVLVAGDVGHTIRVVDVTQGLTSLPTDLITSSVTPPGPSGFPIPTSAPGGWTLIYAEDFLTNVALGAWPATAGGGQPKPPGYSDIQAYPSPWTDPPGPAHYNPAKVLSIHDSCLDVWLHTDSSLGPLAGTVSPVLPGGQNRLRIQICALFPSISGFHVSPLLWPDSNVWPRDGEIDWPEGDLNGSQDATCFVHHQGGTSGGDQDSWNSGVVLSDGAWHVYTLEWVAGNHVTVQREDAGPHTFSTRIPSTPMHYEFQTGAPSTPPGGSSGHILLDWMVVAN